MNSECEIAHRRWGFAWLAMVVALALHVADEALTGFLPVYNQLVGAARANLGWFPMPQFTFSVWLSGLVLLVLLLLALTPLVFRGSRWLRPVAYVFAAIMAVKAIGHTAFSLYLGAPAPGIYSSPVLLFAAVSLAVTTRRAA